MWNGMPVDIKVCKSMYTFKKTGTKLYFAFVVINMY